MSSIELSLAEHVADVTASPSPQGAPAPSPASPATGEDVDRMSSSASCKLLAATSPSGRLEQNFGNSAGSPAVTDILVTLNNASDYRANGLLSDYIGWANGLTD